MQVALVALVVYLSIFPYCSFKILVALLVIVKQIVPPSTHVPCQIQADPLALVRYRSPPFPYQIHVAPPPLTPVWGMSSLARLR